VIINASIQIVPLIANEEAFPVIDTAIGLIQQSGLKHLVGAFETTLEGEYEAVQQLLKRLHDFCYSQKEVHFLLYTKLHVCGGEDIKIEDKISKFKQDPDFSL
jgi:uncharacterized protein YqgV (UPF0045/DUF77 family)